MFEKPEKPKRIPIISHIFQTKEEIDIVDQLTKLGQDSSDLLSSLKELRQQEILICGTCEYAYPLALASLFEVWYEHKDNTGETFSYNNGIFLHCGTCNTYTGTKYIAPTNIGLEGLHVGQITYSKEYPLILVNYKHRKVSQW